MRAENGGKRWWWLVIDGGSGEIVVCGGGMMGNCLYFSIRGILCSERWGQAKSWERDGWGRRALYKYRGMA